MPDRRNELVTEESPSRKGDRGDAGRVPVTLQFVTVSCRWPPEIKPQRESRSTNSVPGPRMTCIVVSRSDHHPSHPDPLLLSSGLCPEYMTRPCGMTVANTRTRTRVEPRFSYGDHSKGTSHLTLNESSFCRGNSFVLTERERSLPGGVGRSKFR